MTARKICILGTSGSGKTTLAKRLATLLQLDHIELDSLFHGPNWTPVPIEEFRARLEARVASDRWITDGNYFKQANIDLLAHADLVIWLNYSFSRTFYQVFRRSITRLITREELWAGNRETFRQTFFTKESILWWVISTYHRRRKQIPELLARHPKLSSRIFTSPAETERWVKMLQAKWNN